MRSSKITKKLTILVAAMMCCFLGAVIFAQFFVISRAYMTSNYTKNRVEDLQKAARLLDENGFSSVKVNDTETMTALLNRYERENHACCFLITGNSEIIAESEGLGNLSPICVTYVQKLFQTGDIFDYSETMFRVKNGIGIPSRYVGIFHTILPKEWRTDQSGVIYFVAVTKEVYTTQNYRLFARYSIVLFLAVLLLSFLFANIFARYVTKPVLRLRDSAMRMSEMDFSCKCDYQKKDELGDLSDSLNFLSDKLSETICTLENTNQKLKSDLDVQLEIDRMRKNFIASASHEFKTPLTLLRGYLEMLQEDCLPEEERKKAERVMIAEIDRLDRLVLNMLDLSYLESDVFEIHMEHFLLNDLVSRYATEFQQQFMEKKIFFDMSGVQKPYVVLADQEEIGRVLSNFLSNAIKNAEFEGKVSLRLQEADGRVKVSVYNQGDHIEEKLMEQIWIPFYRIDRSRVRNRKGTGLGLAICREILLRHNSQYGVHNVYDGVEFYFWLPLAYPTE